MRTLNLDDEAAPTRPFPAQESATTSIGQARVRDLIHEFARIQDQLTAEDHASGSRPSPGSTRRRAEILRRERDVISQLRARNGAADRRA